VEGSRGGQAGSDTEITLSNDEIRQLQIVLRQKGFDIGEPDGVFGQRTRQALILFQQRNGLQATGRIDVRTTTALGISTRSGQQGNQAPGNQQQPTTGQAGNPQQPGGNQPSAN
jgi:peptidoglycan hydrolase-like protein with peptidoglycan-binding domain